MKDADDKRTQGSSKSLRRKVIVVAALIAAQVVAQGCTSATAAGCAVGVVAGVALADVSLAAAKESEQPQPDAGAVVLGGSLFGVASGCSGAAVASAMASPKKRAHSWRAAQSDPEDEKESAERLARFQAFRAQQARSIPRTTPPSPKPQPPQAQPAQAEPAAATSDTPASPGPVAQPTAPAP